MEMEKGRISDGWLNAALAALALIIISSILYFRPYWGLMDDTSHIYLLLPQMDQKGVFRAALDFAQSDLGWGMYRPIYPLMAWALYQPGLQSDPVVSYLLNAIFCFFLLWRLSVLLGRLLTIRWQEILLVCAAFFYAFDLFAFISLQEKLVLLAGLMLFSALECPIEGWVRLVAVLLIAVFGVLTKASFLIYFSAAFFVFLGVNMRQLREGSRYAWLAGALMLLLEACAVCFFYFIGKHGAYTAQYGASRVIPNLVSVEGVMFLAPLSVGLFLSVKRIRQVVGNPMMLTPFIGVLAFVVLLSPWDLKTYIQTVIAPLFACLLLQLASWLGVERLKRLWLPLLVALAFVVVTYRSITLFSRLGDLRGALAVVTDLRQSGVSTVWMPCMEGTDSVRRTISGRNKLAPEMFYRTEFSHLDGTTALYDRANCALPGRLDLPPGCSVGETFFSGRLKSSFRVVSLQCS